MKYACVRNGVASSIGHLGRVIGRYPCYFVFTPLIITAVFSVGLTKTKLNEDEDMNYLTNADTGKTFESQQYVKRMFPMNTSDIFVLEKIIDPPKFPIIIFLNKKGGNMLSKDILLEIEKFDKITKNITVMVEGKVISYSDICAVVMNRCFENPISRLLARVDDVVSKKIRFKYPLELDSLTFANQPYVTNFGGVKTDKDGYVDEANAIRLMYPLDESNSDKSNWIKEWTRKYFKIIKTYDFHYTQFFTEPFRTTELQIISLAEKCKHLIGIILVIITVFCIINFIKYDCVKSKPWLGIAMVVSAGMATVAGFGLMGYCGVEFMQFNIIIPFLIIATEIDDAFVMVACWRITNPRDSVDKRMEATYSEAAVSITLTSLTNILSYCFPMSAQFPTIRIFCFYAATCICFTYIFQITFFGGCLALSGYREEKGIHAFRYTVVKEHNPEYNSFQDEEKEYSMNFLAEHLSNLFSYSSSKVIVILLYFLNLAIGIWGVTNFEEGMDVFRLFPQDSEITEGYRIYYKYFSEYRFTFHIVFDKTLDYSNPQVQKSIEDTMEKFRSHPNIAGSDLEFSWLKYFKEFQKTPISKFLLRGYDLSQKQNFIDALKDVFLKIEIAKPFKYDVIFNKNYTEIISSRFFITAMNLSDRNTEIKVLRDIQKMADDSSLPLIIHSFFGPLAEQEITIKKLTFQLFWQTSILIFFVLIVFIPNLQCSLLVSLCSASIIVETVGYMIFWDVNLDLVSLISLFLCVGFCINYPTHICYSFLCSTNDTIKDKLKNSLFHVGLPIIQGTVTTIIGPLILFYNDMYIYTTFVKVVIIVAMQTAFHALFVIPVMLSITSQIFKLK